MSIFFASFELDTDRRLLLEGGQEIHISKKGYELLRVLLERAPKAISKQELHDLIWPETFVSDTTLPGVIAELRNAMSDDAREPRYIRTVHGFGYAFATKPRISSASPAGTRGARLLVHGREMFLNPGENIIGRDPDTTIYVDDLSVSRKHVRIVVSDADAILEDLGSKNGTLHNGAAVKEPVTLRDRDVVTLGSMTIVFRASSDAGPT
ncbi:MAG: winged helix-turn-helix domain-containing protein, partial [Thermoanaerobaculia bacterium]